MLISKTLHDGFSFSEIMLSLAMVGFLLTSLLALQSTVFRRVVTNTFRIDRFYPLKNMMLTMPMHPLKKGETKQETTNDQLGFKMVYEQIPVKEQSALFRFKGLYQKKVTGRWFEYERERVQELLSYGFAIPGKKP